MWEQVGIRSNILITGVRLLSDYLKHSTLKIICMNQTLTVMHRHKFWNFFSLPSTCLIIFAWYIFLPPNKQNLFSCPLVEQKAVLSGEEQERKITTYEEAMNKIKDTTGVSDIKEVVQRFLSQGETQKHLEQLKTNNEKMLVRLKEEKVPFQGLCLL